MKNVLTILFTIALLTLPAPAAAEGEGRASRRDLRQNTLRRTHFFTESERGNVI